MSDHQRENWFIRYLRRLWKFWAPDLSSLLWLLMGVMAILFFQTVIHEGSHVIAHALQGHEITGFRPFPHDGFWGAMNPIYPDTGQPPELDEIIATPQLVEIALLLLLSLFLWLVPYLWQMREVIISMVAFIGDFRQYIGDVRFHIFFWLQCLFCVWYWTCFGLTFRYARTLKAP